MKPNCRLVAKRAGPLLWPGIKSSEEDRDGKSSEETRSIQGRVSG